MLFKNFNSFLNNYRDVTEEQIFGYYLNLDCINESLFHSPFRVDNLPSCKFSYYNGKLQLYDFGTQETFNFIELLKKLFNLKNASEVYSKIEQDITEIINHKIKVDIEEDLSSYEISVTYRKWDKEDEDYWIVPKDIIKKANIFPVKNVYFNGKEQYFLKDKQGNKTYAYFHSEGKFKIYKPNDDKYKWRGNLKMFDISYIGNLNHKKILTTSLKDAVSLYYLTNESYYIYCYQSESIKLSKKDMLKNTVLAIGDNDTTGIKWLKNISKITNNKVKCLMFKDYKDIFDYLKDNRKQWEIIEPQDIIGREELLLI